MATQIKDPVSAPASRPAAAAYAADGFVVLPQLITPEFCEILNARLERVLRGEHDTGTPPDKAPTFKAEARAKPGKAPPPIGGPSKRTLQIINIWKADAAFASLVRSPTLGKIVAEVAGWPSGARVANDQVWAKPPGGAALTFHRDSPYFDFVPSDVATVWIALDEMLDEELGLLEYCPTSHKWGDGRVGSANQFFDTSDRYALLYDAARREGIEKSDVRIETLKVKAGGIGIHDGRLWHGSGPNTTANRPRRGLGIHFVPACAKFREPDAGTTHAHRFAGSGVEKDGVLPEASFPITYRGGGQAPATATANTMKVRGGGDEAPAAPTTAATTIKIKVAFFAAVREAVGEAEIDLDVAADARTSPEFVNALLAAYPQIDKLLPRCALAVNGEYVEAPVVLKDGDEVAVLPPMSGG